MPVPHRPTCRSAGLVAVLLTAIATLPAVASARPAYDGPGYRLPELGTPASSPVNAVVEWNENAADAALASCIAPLDNPLHESRMYAMTQVAVHDALNAIDRRSEPYAYEGRARRASPQAAVAAAARSVLVPVIRQLPAPVPAECIGAGVARVEEDYAAALAAIPDGGRKARGLELGRAAAAAILARRATDGADTPQQAFDYPQGTAPGEYRFTPGFPFAFAPGWGEVTPFVLRDSAQYRTEPPYALTDRRYTADFDEVKRLGGDGVTTPSARTPQQTETALFWLESSPQQWNRIARTLAATRGLDPWKSARLFGLVDLALADGYIGSFETKYHYRFWRPVTAIQAAADDGNQDTTPVPDWTPLAPTPPIPDQTSAHAVEGGAAAEVMRRFFGTDRLRFTTCSLTLPAGARCSDATPVRRTYDSPTKAADENALSRILIGFHFRKAVKDGLEQGRKIGSRTSRRFLLPTSR